MKRKNQINLKTEKLKQQDKLKPQEKSNSIKKKLLIMFLKLLIIAVIFIAIFLFYKLSTFNKLAMQMFNNSPSLVLDSENNTIAQLGEERNRNNVTLDKIPSNLINAYISIEDQRYYSHHGVDIKRTLAAIISYVIKKGSSSFGGSTITQQLVKNITGDDSNSITRKVKEWFYAWSLNNNFTKEEILEAYLNIIYTGPNIYGVQAASKYYFNKDITDLDLVECAFLAGINNAPNAYNPFDTNDDKTPKIKKRTQTVLNQMLKQNYITQDNYDNALSDLEKGLNFSKGSFESKSNIYSYHTDALINEVISDLMSKKHISQTFATNYLYLSGSVIYSTLDNSIQSTLEKEFENKKYILSSSISSETSQASMVIIDHSTGQVVACTGGLGKKDKSRCFNRATQMKRQTGSAMKPIAVLAPAISEKIITNVTVFADQPTTFTDYNNELYTPTNYDGYKGSITLRKAVESSQNIPFVQIMENLTPEVSIKYLKKMGISTLNENDINLSLALGGLDEGISPLEFTSAYATIANDGIYIEPIFYTKIVSHSGNDVFIKKQKTRKVFTKDVSYILKQLLTEPVTGRLGTAKYCNIPGMDIAAKTGTTNENYDRWLAGFTTYYTSVCWYGFDMNETINFNGKNPAGLIWSNVMHKIHSNLPKTKFEITPGIITQKVCSASGKIANSTCPETYTEYFLKGTVPNTCTQHSNSALLNP